MLAYDVMLKNDVSKTWMYPSYSKPILERQVIKYTQKAEVIQLLQMDELISSGLRNMVGKRLKCLQRKKYFTNMDEEPQKKISLCVRIFTANETIPIKTPRILIFTYFF